MMKSKIGRDEGEADQEAAGDGHERGDEPCPQLVEVVEERHLPAAAVLVVILDVVVDGRLAGSRRTPRSLRSGRRRGRGRHGCCRRFGNPGGRHRRGAFRHVGRAGRVRLGLGNRRGGRHQRRAFRCGGSGSLLRNGRGGRRLFGNRSLGHRVRCGVRRLRSVRSDAGPASAPRRPAPWTRPPAWRLRLRPVRLHPDPRRRPAHRTRPDSEAAAFRAAGCGARRSSIRISSSSVLRSSFDARLNSPRLLPRDRPSSGSFRGPNTIKAITRMMTISQMPIGPNMVMLLVVNLPVTRSVHYRNARAGRSRARGGSRILRSCCCTVAYLLASAPCEL